VSLAQEAVVGEPVPAFEPGEIGYADWVIVALHGLRDYLGHSYRQLLDVLHEIPRIVSKLDGVVAELPDFTTVCTRMKNLAMARWRVLLSLSAHLHEPGAVQAIDATGFDRRAASRRYAKRTDHTFKAVKTTVLVDCGTSTILDIHCSMKRLHDMQIGEQLLERDFDRLEIITADKGYNWDDLRQELREAGVRSVVKHREFSSLDAAHNARLDDETYHRRSGTSRGSSTDRQATSNGRPSLTPGTAGYRSSSATTHCSPSRKDD
jgi:IS5 family transposase